ncbi:3-phosphoshikimate 1-carboxyvinyltransferase [Fibrobacteres bacterium R8-0-B4]
MITLHPAKSMQGKLNLPPSPDLLYMAALAACAAKLRVSINGISNRSSVIDDILRSLQSHANIELVDSTLSISPKPINTTDNTVDNTTINTVNAEETLLLTIPDSLLPYRTVYIFMGLGMGKTVVSRSTPQRQIADFIARAKGIGITVESIDIDDTKGLRAVSFDGGIAEDSCPNEDDCAALLAFLLGKRGKLTFAITDHHLSTPLRRLAHALGFSVNVRQNTPEGEDTEMARRLRFMRSKQKGNLADAQNQQSFIVEADFSTINTDAANAVNIAIPGDETLAAALITAKALIPKGDFELSNVALDPWASQAVSFLKKMGAKINTDEQTKTAFGPAGAVTVQKSERVGRKARCIPLYHYLGQLPCMTIAAAFAEGKSVFRDLEPMRLFDPDGLEQLEQCLRPLGIRHGEMPDGMVIEGAKEFDGFDILEPLPAHIAAAFCVAGIKCHGKTSIADDFVFARWPDFEKMIHEIFEFRGK